MNKNMILHKILVIISSNIKKVIMFKWGLAQKSIVGLTFSNQSINIMHHIKKKSI